MSHTKTLKTTYKDVPVILNLSTNQYSIDYLDLVGHYASMAEAEKAIRTWLKPEKSEPANPATKVLVISEYREEGDFKEATTRFAVQENASSWSGPRIWVTYTKKDRWNDKGKSAVKPSQIILDTPENRATLAKAKKLYKEMEASESKFETAIAATYRKLKVAKKP